MSTERHHYKYLIIDSSKENNNQVEAKFSVHIPHGLVNCSRVCVKSFTMPNTIHNVYGDIETVQWIEFYQPSLQTGWIYEVFTFSIKSEYNLTANLVESIIQNKFNEMSTRVFDGRADIATAVTLSHNTQTYKNTISADSGNQYKALGLFVENQNTSTIWENLGFDKRKIITRAKIDSIVEKLNNEFGGRETLTSVGISTYYKNKYYLVGAKSDADNTIENRTLTPGHAGTHENLSGLYICSKSLGTDSFECKTHGDNIMVAQHTDVIQFINNDVPKFSHISYHSELPMWNTLHDATFNRFDIEIRDHRGQVFPRNALADFILVLMFEEIKEIEYTKEFIEAYNLEGYRVGHPIR